MPASGACGVRRYAGPPFIVNHQARVGPTAGQGRHGEPRLCSFGSVFQFSYAGSRANGDPFPVHQTKRQQPGLALTDELRGALTVVSRSRTDEKDESREPKSCWPTYAGTAPATRPTWAAWTTFCAAEVRHSSRQHSQFCKTVAVVVLQSCKSAIRPLDAGPQRSGGSRRGK